MGRRELTDEFDAHQAQYLASQLAHYGYNPGPVDASRLADEMSRKMYHQSGKISVERINHFAAHMRASELIAADFEC